jgi:hypothetical protein
VLGLGALFTLLIMLAIGLAKHIGPVGAGLIVAGVVGLIAFLLVRYGIARLGALAGDDEEKASLSNAERKS